MPTIVGIFCKKEIRLWTIISVKETYLTVNGDLF